MELLLVVSVDAQPPAEIRVEADPLAPVDEVVRAVAQQIGAEFPAQAWLVRTGEPLAPHAPLSEAGLVHGDQLELTPPGRAPAALAQQATGIPASFVLSVVGGPRAGRRYPLHPGGSYLLGRDGGADIDLEDPRASRRHVHLGVGTKSVVATDAGSTNGSFVDGLPSLHRPNCAPARSSRWAPRCSRSRRSGPRHRRVT